MSAGPRVIRIRAGSWPMMPRAELGHSNYLLALMSLCEPSVLLLFSFLPDFNAFFFPAIRCLQFCF